jgi:hypothetical protein
MKVPAAGRRWAQGRVQRGAVVPMAWAALSAQRPPGPALAPPGRAGQQRRVGIRGFMQMLYDGFVPSSPLFWPTGRKLFRQRSRLRVYLPLAAVLVLAGLAVAFGPTVWV